MSTNPADAGPMLRDIHAPPPPGWWPPAPGWWVLAAILIAALLVLFLYALRKSRIAAKRRAILGELDSCIDAAGGEPAALAAALSQFLRRMSLRDGAVVGLYGEPWLQHLDQRLLTTEFSTGIGRVLIEAPFRRSMPFDTVALIALVRRWTRRTLDGRSAHA